jgi:hypothetical protein
LALILQIFDTVSGRSEEFLFNLRRIEFQAGLIADNPTYDLNSEATRNFVEDKSRDLMTSIVRYFNSALLYFSNSFLGKPSIFLLIQGNVAHSVIDNPDDYTETLKELDNAIREYDQAVLHLAARVVAGIIFQSSY